jgi:hypothetical protein
MRWGCSGLLQCLQVRRIVSEWAAPNEFSFVVEFSNRDGTPFKLVTCCDETGETFTQFPYTMKKTGGHFLVQELPVYLL